LYTSFLRAKPQEWSIDSEHQSGVLNRHRFPDGYEFLIASE
jgi:hypothetical protein